MTYIFKTWRIFFESIPVILAFVTLILSFSRSLVTTNTHVMRMCWLFILSSCVLIFAQSSWSRSLLVSNEDVNPDFLHIVWSIFNTITMMSMSYAVYWVGKK